MNDWRHKQLWEDAGVCVCAYTHGSLSQSEGTCHSVSSMEVDFVISDRNFCLGLHTREFVFLLSKGYMFKFKDKVHCEDDQVPTSLLAARNFEANHKGAFSSF